MAKLNEFFIVELVHLVLQVEAHLLCCKPYVELEVLDQVFFTSLKHFLYCRIVHELLDLSIPHLLHVFRVTVHVLDRLFFQSLCE